MELPPLEIESLDHEARGIAHSNGKVIFVEGALTGERVRYRTFKRKPSYELGRAIEILRPSSQRVVPRCPSFGTCGGCSMQHLDTGAQVSSKQRVLEENLARIGKVRPELVFRPIHGPSWGYRFRARISVQQRVETDEIILGFHKRKSNYLVDMRSCDVLPVRISNLLAPLRELISSLTIRLSLPQIELAIGEETVVFVLRLLEPFAAGDADLVNAFAAHHSVRFWIQRGGPESATPMVSGESPLAFSLPEFGVHMPFQPTDFTQVNHQINRTLVGRAVRLLHPEPDDRVLDLFCGLGNFTLPLATRSAHVTGIEGSPQLTQRAQQNAVENRLGEKTSFLTANLFEPDVAQFRSLGRFEKVLIDPPRDGAVELARMWAANADLRPQRIVYVSCNPSTLARDADILTHAAGFRLRGAGVVNMFPQTSHVESIALFEQ